MKIIFNFGTEVKLFDKENRAYKRIREYAIISDWYYNFTFTPDIEFKDYRSIDSNFINIAIYGSNKFTQIFNLSKTVKREFKHLNISNKITNTEKEKKEIYFSSQDPFEIGLLTFILSKIYKTKFIVQVHIDFFSSFFKKESIRQYLQYHIARYLILKQAYHIRVVSQKIEKYLIQNMLINTKKIFLLPVIVDLEFSLKEKKDNADLVLLSISRFVKQKNIYKLIKAFTVLKDKYTEDRIVNSELHIYGDGPERVNIENIIAKNKYAKYIKLKTWVNTPSEIMYKTDFFCISSDYEGWAMTAVESVSVGTPVIMTPVGCAGEFIKDGVNGFVAKDFTINEYVKTIEKAINFRFDKNIMRESLINLKSKEEYFLSLSQIYS